MTELNSTGRVSQLSPSDFFDEIRGMLAEAVVGTEYEEHVAAIAPDTHLFDLGIIDSFLAVQIVGYLEEVCGGGIDFDTVDPLELYSVERMYEFCRQEAEAGPGS